MASRTSCQAVQSRRSIQRLFSTSVASKNYGFAYTLGSPAKAQLLARTSIPRQHVRCSSHAPMGSTPLNTRKKVTITTLTNMYRKKEPIAALTAHDFPSASVAEAAGVDVVLVGDSLSMVALGHSDTSEITMEEMLSHCRAVSRAVDKAFLVGDLPMGTYEVSKEQATESAIRMIKEGRVQGIKIEGGAEIAPTIRHITQAGIPVVAHIGLTPQRANSLGGFRVQAKSVASALKLLEDARAVQDAGAFMVVLEAVPEEVASIVTQKISIPTIGIGAGVGCSGQILVQVDMSGYYPPGRFLPKFVKKYGDVWGENFKAVSQYKEEVKSRAFPATEHTYPVSQEELDDFKKAVEESS